jgi:hypothetical protein
MRLDSEFIRLPLAFDVDRLRVEALQFNEHEWDYHPQRYDGNTALNLISRDGQRSDSYVGEMQATKALQQCPYIKQLMASFGTVIGRSRFMRLAPGKGVPPHSDTDYSWRNRVRIHIPIVTDEKVIFSSTGNIDIHMRAGEAWIFDNWREHAVINESDIQRIHLVIDTVGTSVFWKLAEQGLDPRFPQKAWSDSIKRIGFDTQLSAQLDIEKYNLLPVRSPDEVNNLCTEFLGEIAHLQSGQEVAYTQIKLRCAQFVQDWRGLWALHWDAPSAVPHYQALAQTLKVYLNKALGNAVLQSNKVRAYDVIANWLDMSSDSSIPNNRPDIVANVEGPKPLAYAGKIPRFDSPVFIVAAPRSGSTMLFEALKSNKEVWSIGDEAHREIESIAELHPSNRGFDSNALGASDCSDSVKQSLIDALMYRLQNSRSAAFSEMPPEFQPSAIRFLEKTPKNALRIKFFKQMFPDAKFIYLHRQAKPNIASIMDAWLSEKFITYKDLPEWQAANWSLLLPEGWREYRGKPLEQIAAFQWSACNRKIITDLTTFPEEDYMTLSYESLLANTGHEMERVCKFMRVPFGPKMRSFAVSGFPHSKYALSAPSKDKWLRHESEVQSVVDIFAKTNQQLKTFTQT